MYFALLGAIGGGNVLTISASRLCSGGWLVVLSSWLGQIEWRGINKQK